MINVSLSRSELLAFANSLPGFCYVDLSRISSVFIAQIMQLYYGRIINVFNITNKIESLEGIRKNSSIKNESEFRYNPLKGLMKVHFTDARFILKNIINKLNGDDYIYKVVDEGFNKNNSGYADDDLFKYICHQLTVGAYNEKIEIKNMTGEWIVFQKYNGENYCLTLGSHSEGDENIYKRVCIAYEKDFPFLKNIL
ncbi:hypothetical protein [Photorhabdus akhurstii]|uniref:hypothetical protein n=1 Tax=Photorhabdus akhurstii TaxID=171438 RepID=UPI001BD61436|nr:hypothetical protein [Photorhabdus akhurstii]MBS9430563.1 hypothetical protein [Photorhabdus akhurstii]